MSTLKSDFINQNKTIVLDNESISSDIIIDIISETNEYIQFVHHLFKELEFDFFDVLGQRNLSGVVGAIFSQFFCKHIPTFVVNPHADGTPDLLNIANDDIKKYFLEKCFMYKSSKVIPLKNMLSPFVYGGIEVKCTIGSPITNYKKVLLEDTGSNSFALGIPRIKYLSSFNYWAHHRKSTRMVSLYYDYYSLANNTPQILAAFFAELIKEDWNQVSLGSENAKKTSNTSLNITGRDKIYNGCICIINQEEYIDKLREIGISLNEH